MDKKLPLRINSLLEHINKVLNSTKDVTIDDFKNSDLLLRTTAFSIMQIGEQMNKLEKLLKDKYPNLPWDSARATRNVIVHDYDSIDIDMLFSTVKIDLPILKEAFEEVKKDLMN